MVRRAIDLLGVLPLASICAYRMVTLALNTRSWQALLPAGERWHFAPLLRYRWIGESINGLFPVAQVGGDVARARLLTARGVPAADAAAAMIADLFTGVSTQVIFGIAGVIALASAGAAGWLGRVPAREIAVGLLLAAVTGVGLYALLRAGSGRLLSRALGSARARSLSLKVAGTLSRFDDAKTALLGRRRALAAAFGWHCLGWFSQVGETWIVLALVGAPVSFTVALAIEALTAAVRGAAFFVPGGVGVQEITVLSLCRLVGVGVEPALALGIAKRARELIIGAPGVMAWLLAERDLRRLLRAPSRGDDAGSSADA
jgi:putative membrane protein